ncbi:MAG TPA: succinate dehydrogenase/fumarate reductase iron-sulfur subunit [Candidatus Lokiarchaeia archaeon]|nr:succinate dehydrogenase/fumarate reductase iron-sulfur subunit [Candidatus Lokiarchaeia archaeon]
MEEMAKLLVYRKDIDTDVPRYEHYEVPVFQGMNLLEALFYIQDYVDSTFAFRYSCRGAICGSCGVTVDKIPQLACRTLVATVKTEKKPLNVPEYVFGDVPDDWDKENEILVEPLPNMQVLKDLVVDMGPFWKFYRATHPFFTRAWNDQPPESEQEPTNAQSVEHLIYCILCGICWACPVNAKNPEYFGPAALAKAYRFLSDTRNTEDSRQSILESVSQEDAVPACEKHFVCNRVCPKGVNPGTAIQDIRKYG